jgi:hypothetical protein
MAGNGKIVGLIFAGIGIVYADESSCRVVKADVVALDQAFYVNRMGSLQTGGMIFALRSDVQSNDPKTNELNAGQVMLRPDKRPRPIVLRMNVDDCLVVTFQNLLSQGPAGIKRDNAPVQTNGSGFDPKKEIVGGPFQMAPANPDPNANPLDPYYRAQSATRYAVIHVMGMQPGNILSDGSSVGTNNSILTNPRDKITYRVYA